MDSFANAALISWAFDPGVIVVLLALGVIYLRGWRLRRRLVRYASDGPRCLSFMAGLLLLFLALGSPLDAFDGMFLSAHMTQHLLLMMLAPPLILLGHPVLPLLRGLPKPFVKEGLGPFLTWAPVKQLSEWITAPPVTWLAFVLSTVLWHLPAAYELALSSPVWHGLQHACFFWTGILFWWPVIRPGNHRSKWPSWITVPYLLFSDIVNTLIGAMFVFSGRLLYPSYEAAHAASLSPQDDQTIAGLIMWVPGSLVYLLPAFVFGMRLLMQPQTEREVPLRVARKKEAKRVRRPAALRRAMQIGMLLVAIAVAADGWFGPQAAPLNLAGVLPWIHWRALSLVALLVIGNLFCMACPFTLVRDGWRRILPARLRWPRALRNKWLAAALLVVYLWTYEAFALWDSPSLTAWIIAGYFLAALLVDGLFKGASFCKYVCPIGQFHFVASLVSPAEVRVRRGEVCQSCRTYDCIRGNEHVRGCELNLFQPKKSGNLDCTFCLDCVQACPHGNVALLSVLPAKTIATPDVQRSSLGRLAARTDLAVLALVFVFGAFTNAAGMVGPVLAFEHGWHARLGAHAMPWIVGAFVLLGTVVLPLGAALLCGALNRLQGAGADWPNTVRRLAFASVPLGAAMWAAHLLFHLATTWRAAIPALERFASEAQVHVAGASSPVWLPGAQILLLDAGLLAAIYLGWRVLASSGETKAAIARLVPWAVLFTGLYAAGVWTFFAPMQMRGMVMN